MTVVGDAFLELFYGTGTWLGILIFLSIIIALMLKWKYSGLLLLPVTVFIGLDYLENDLIWQSVMMFISSMFIIIYMGKTMNK